MNGTKEDILLSICIPTRGRNNILQNTLTSIFNSEVSTKDYEVIIYDSSDDNELERILLKDYSYPNLIYKKGENYGFLNLIEALKMGQGSFLKLHNDYSELCQGSLQEILKLIKSNLLTKPLLFFSNASLKNIEIKEYLTFDNFLYNTSYYSSWSTAFGIWKMDFEKLKHIKINPMFPHTSLLFALYDKQIYLVINSKLFNNQDISNKGGYNLFETFAIIYLGMVNDCLKKGQITKDTFHRVKLDMMKTFFIVWYCDTKILKKGYTFILTNIKYSINVYYSNRSYYYMVLFAYLRAFKVFLTKLLKKSNKKIEI